ncbi:Armadillo-type fold containing protein [Cryptosporidium tyzzeri]|nr:Armadillo-type fold containing protein [Cryptosporidium tyzzeri]
MAVGYINSNDELEAAMKNMKSYDSNKRIQGIQLFADVIKTDCSLLSIEYIKKLQIVFECEHNIEVLLQLSKSCTNLGLISLFEDQICRLNINEFDFFSKGCIFNAAKQIIYNAYDNFSTRFHTSKRKSNKNSLFTIEKIITLVPILQDIAELDDVYVRLETMKSLKSLINIITFLIEENLNNIHKSTEYNELELIFNYSLEIFQKLANSDILSHKILSCHIIPLILEQKRLSEIFVDEKNILLAKYSDFCVHPAPILRKHASKVFNAILEQIEFEEGIIEILLFPIIRNFCCDEQEGVRLIAIENIEAFFLQVFELANSNKEYIKKVIIFFEKLQPFIFILYNDVSWRIRSNVSRPIINIYSKLYRLVTSSEAENIDIHRIKEQSIIKSNQVKNENLKIVDNENESQNLDILIDKDNFCSHPCSKDNSSVNYIDYLNKLALILTQLLIDLESETRISTLSNVLKTIEEQTIESRPTITDDKSTIPYISKILFYDVIIKQINNSNTLLADQNAAVRINLSRITKIIMLVKTNFEIDEFMNIELENAFDHLVTKLTHDEDDQVRQSVVLALCSGVSESTDINFLIKKIILPHSSSMIQDNFWRVRYCSIILLILSLYKLLSSHYEEDEIWNCKINFNNDENTKDFLNYYEGTIDVLIELIIMNITDKTNIIRQLTSIFSLPLLSSWFGLEWTKNQLWSKNILPMITNEKSYIMRITGLLSANSIISGVCIRSFKELLDVIKHVIQLILIVAPTLDPGNEDYQPYQEHLEVTNSQLTTNQSDRNELIKNTEFLNSGLAQNNIFSLSSRSNHLTEYLPLINASNLTLSLNPSDKNHNTRKKSKSISFDFSEFQLEIISVVLQYSVNDIVPNVRAKAFQTINSIIDRNGLGNFQKSVIDQVKYSYENDPDSDVRTYCRYILKKTIEYEINEDYN